MAATDFTGDGLLKGCSEQFIFPDMKFKLMAEAVRAQAAIIAVSANVYISGRDIAKLLQYFPYFPLPKPFFNRTAWQVCQQGFYT